MATRKKAEAEVLEGEIIVSESPGGAPGGTRTLWIYHPRDDFKITIPSEARVTFGYFNPAAAGSGREQNPWGRGGGGGETMKTTCLRVYADKTDKTQIAAFLGVDGFRDMETVKKTVLRRKVTIETNYEDDGIGNVTDAKKQLTAGAVYDEDEIAF